ncbi:MAG: transposase [Eubacteriales bacterium]
MDLPKRKRIRLEGYDYSQNGAYFITICTQNRECLLGDIIVGQGLCSCRLSKSGNDVKQEIENIDTHFSGIHIDKYVIMPNHVHMILVLRRQSVLCVGRQEQSPCPTVGDIICAVKSLSTKTANKNDGVIGRKIWQYRFYDHIIRNEQEYQKIWEYIDTNPLKWSEDCFYVQG